jgi:hypothetical protein
MIQFEVLSQKSTEELGKITINLNLISQRRR